MRVIKTRGSDQDGWTPRLCTHRDQPYAILSHRWSNDPNHEVLFSDIEEIDTTVDARSTESEVTVIKNSQYKDSDPCRKPSFSKVQGAASQALHQGLDYLWIDTCCIDKNSSAELSEAINSMYQWYGNSTICFVYLVDVPDEPDAQSHSFAKSDWWNRGWTLQELLAPSELVFFTTGWKNLGDKKDLAFSISEITGVDANIVNGALPLSTKSIAQRMSWVSQRSTTRS